MLGVVSLEGKSFTPWVVEDSRRGSSFDEITGIKCKYPFAAVCTIWPGVILLRSAHQSRDELVGQGCFPVESSGEA